MESARTCAFPSKKGMRQGYCLSPNLFVVVQNVLYMLLNRASAFIRIGRHHKCDQVHVTPLIFADDILVFTDGSASSLREIVLVLEEF